MVVSKSLNDKLYRHKYIEGLGITDIKTMLAGLTQPEREAWAA